MQGEVHILGHEERIAYAVRPLRCLTALLTDRFAVRLFLRAAVGAEPLHELVEVAMVGNDTQVTLQNRVFAEPLANVVHVPLEVEVRFAQFNT